ncbi:MAG: hypothetical protein ACC653_11200 [Gammaproteobacteria bacterium]
MKLSNIVKIGVVFTLVSWSATALIAETGTDNKKSASSSSKEIYRNVNEDGVVEFTDQGVANSEKIKLKTTNTFKAADKKITPRPEINDDSNDSGTQNVAKYSQIAISSPTPDQQIRSNDGLLTVSISISPGLNIAAGDQIELYFDGRSQGKQTSTQFSLKDVYRGQHRVQAKIINKSGVVLKISKPVQFVIHKFSILNKPKARG